MNRINQIYISQSVKSFSERFTKKFGLSKYYSKYEPSIFVGCYPTRAEDFNTLVSHKNIAILRWSGTDILHMLKRDNIKKLMILKGKKNIKHIAISNFISRDLDKVGIKYKKLPITSCDTNIFASKICPLGNDIYVYSSHGNPEFYGMSHINAIREKLKDINFIIGYARGKDSVDHSCIHSVYERCFMGIRLTKHDGLSNTVIELGLMGRKCIWNGDTPNAIHWNNYDDIIKNILIEKQKIGLINSEVSKNMQRYLSVDESWLNVNSYK